MFPCRYVLGIVEQTKPFITANEWHSYGMLYTRVPTATCLNSLTNNNPRVRPPQCIVCAQDEKALRFISTVPRKWRLFWAIKSIGISFALALVAILYAGDGSLLLKANTDIIKSFLTWFIWGLNPAALTLSSVLLSSALQAVCELVNELCEGVHDVSCSCMLPKTLEIVNTAVKSLNGWLRAEFLFCVISGLWCLHGVANYSSLTNNNGFPVALSLGPTSRSSEEYTLDITENKIFFIGLNTILAAGLAAKTVGVVRTNNNRVAVISKPPVSSDDTCQGQALQSYGGASSRVPSLLIGWGTGYSVTSLLYALGSSLNGGRRSNAPIILTVIGYVVLPFFLVALVFVAADTNFLGSKLGAFVKPAIDIVRNKSRVEYWIIATVLRDFLVFWIGFWASLKSLVNFW